MTPADLDRLDALYADESRAAYVELKNDLVRAWPAISKTLRERAQPSAEPGYVKVNTGQPIKCPVQPDGHCYNPEVCTATGACVIHGSMPVQHAPAADAPDELLREIDGWFSAIDRTASGKSMVSVDVRGLKDVLQRTRDRIAAQDNDARSQAQDMARQNIRIAELERALAEREKDAARYRWLRKHFRFANDDVFELWFDATLTLPPLEDTASLDAAIDRALASAGPTPGDST